MKRTTRGLVSLSLSLGADLSMSFPRGTCAQVSTSEILPDPPRSSGAVIISVAAWMFASASASSRVVTLSPNHLRSISATSLCTIRAPRASRVHKAVHACRSVHRGARTGHVALTDRRVLN